MKYESPITYHSKDMANVKVLSFRQVGQTSRSRSHDTVFVYYRDQYSVCVVRILVYSVCVVQI
jgi:hypothetical protein